MSSAPTDSRETAARIELISACLHRVFETLEELDARLKNLENTLMKPRSEENVYE